MAAKKKAPVKKAPPKKKQELMTAEERRRELVDFPSTRELANREKKKLFLEALSQRGTIVGACETVGISRMTYYLWTDPKWAEHYGLDVEKHFDPDFQAAVVQATVAFGQKVMQTGVDRAVEGWVDNHYDRNGALIKEEHKYDSAILQMLMKKVDPSLKDKGAEINVNNDNRSLTVNGADKSAEVLDNLTPEQQALLVQLVEATPRDDDAIEGEVTKKE